jgi:hypothetical protein
MGRTAERIVVAVPSSTPPEGLRASGDDAAVRPPDGEIVAAITAAIVYLRQRHGAAGGLGSSLEEGPGGWWRAGVSGRSNSTPEGQGNQT